MTPLAWSPVFNKCQAKGCIAGMALFCIAGAVCYGTDSSSDPRQHSAFTLNRVEYFEIWSHGNQNEFTPKGQEDPANWSDMVTIVPYRNAGDGNGLAVKANAVFDLYRKNGARILKTNSVPRTSEKPAEHLIVAEFDRPHFTEVTFARFKIVEGVGCALVYSHRFYGSDEKTIKDEAAAWLGSNGQATERALMGWDTIPSTATLAN